MPEPVKPEFKGDHFLFYGPWKKYEQEMSAYNSRPRYPVSKELADSWSDGQKVVEGKDFGLDCLRCMNGALESDHVKLNVAAPIRKMLFHETRNNINT